MSNGWKKRGREAEASGKRFHPSLSSEEHSGEVADGSLMHNSPVIQMFRKFQEELDQRHDKYERLVKSSRNITIESKRVIFLLHRIDSDESREKILGEVKQKMDLLLNNEWYQVALELQHEDPYQFIRAYSPGLQEYVEALAFFYYMGQRTLLTPQQLEQNLTFSEHSDADDSENQSGFVAKNIDRSDDAVGTTSLKHISVHVPPTEYMLGLADLTGEMMRMAINCIGRGEFQTPFELCQYIRSMHNAFLSYGNQSREMLIKFGVLRQSLRKVEDACYALKVRGSEMPKHLLADVLNSISNRPLYCQTANEDCSD